MGLLKKPTTYDEQLKVLQSRNVIVENPGRCIAILESVNYYRFSAYFLPFKQEDDFCQAGTRFSTIYHLYEFDRKLRCILLSALEEVEIYIRAKIAYFHGHKYGADGYMDFNNFSNRHLSYNFRENLMREIEHNVRASFVRHHNDHYAGQFPIWVAVELFTFGMLSRFYSNMKTADRKKLARDLYEITPKKMISWLRCCTDLRNICAHYGRLYYRIFPATPASIDASPIQAQRLWGAVLALYNLYPHAEKWNNEILPQLCALFEEYQADIALEHIGFPENWREQLLATSK